VAEILQNVAGRLAPYKVPEGLRVIEALPRNALSKVDRRALERMIGEDESGGSRSEAVPSRERPAPRLAQKRYLRSAWPCWRPEPAFRCTGDRVPPDRPSPSVRFRCPRPCSGMPPRRHQILRPTSCRARRPRRSCRASSTTCRSGFEDSLRGSPPRL